MKYKKTDNSASEVFKKSEYGEFVDSITDLNDYKVKLMYLSFLLYDIMDKWYDRLEKWELLKPFFGYNVDKIQDKACAIIDRGMENTDDEQVVKESLYEMCGLIKTDLFGLLSQVIDKLRDYDTKKDIYNSFARHEVDKVYAETKRRAKKNGEIFP